MNNRTITRRWLTHQNVLILCCLLFMHVPNSTAVDATLEWDEAPDPMVDHFEVHWGITSGNYIYSVEDRHPPVTITDLAEGQTYYFRVRACTADGIKCSRYSNEIYTTSAPPPVAVFSADIESGPAPLTVTFTNTSSNATSSTWAFGDGDTSEEESPSHTYTASDTYSVTLVVTGYGGTTSTDYKGDYIAVIAAEPEPEPEPEPQPKPEPKDEEPADVELQLEAGEALVDHNWTTVAMDKNFHNPVVLVKPLSMKGGAPAVVQVRNVTNNSFALRVHEWSYLNGPHATESVGFIVIEAGRHQLPNGHWIEAGTIDIDSSNPASMVSFEAAFLVNPIVISTVASNKDSSDTAVTTRMQNISGYGFEIGLEKEEGLPQDHAVETVNYLAWQPSTGEVDGYTYEAGRTADAVTHQRYRIDFSTAFETAPVFLADMQTTNDGDTANVRWGSKTNSYVTIRIDEEQSADKETSHTTEVVGFIVLK